MVSLEFGNILSHSLAFVVEKTSKRIVFFCGKEGHSVWVGFLFYSSTASLTVDDNLNNFREKCFVA